MPGSSPLCVPKLLAAGLNMNWVTASFRSEEREDSLLCVVVAAADSCTTTVRMSPVRPALRSANIERSLPPSAGQRESARAAGAGSVAVQLIQDFDRAFPLSAERPAAYLLGARLLNEDFGDAAEARRLLEEIVRRPGNDPVTAQARAYLATLPARGVKVKLSCPLAPAGMRSVVLLKVPPSLDATLIATGAASDPRAYTVMVTLRPAGAQPPPSSKITALCTPAALFIGPACCGSRVRFWCQPGMWLVGRLRCVQCAPPAHENTSTPLSRA